MVMQYSVIAPGCACRPTSVEIRHTPADVGAAPPGGTHSDGAVAHDEALVRAAEALERQAASQARSEPPLPEIAGPREEILVDLAQLFVARRRTSLRIQGVTDPSDPDDKIWEDGSLLANLHATLADPTFEALALTPTTPRRRLMGPADR